MMRTAIAGIGLLLLSLGCSSIPAGTVNVERHAFELAEKNRLAINKVRLGQTFAEVEKIMGPPERRAARVRFDGLSVEEWSYVTDYVRKMDGLILFVGGRVNEIQSSPWDERGEERKDAD